VKLLHLLPALALTLAGCGGAKQTVVVYSPHGPEMLRDYERLFEEAHPEVDVQWLDLASNQAYSRIAAEKNRPQADVWWGGSSTLFMQAAEDGLLAPYEPAWAEAVDARYRDAEHRWYGTFRSPLAIVFNDRHYGRKDVPQTWDALIGPHWDGLITLRKPLPSSTMRTFIGAMILREGGLEEGLDYLGRLHESTKSYMEQPQVLFDHLKRNPELITVWLMPDAVLQRNLNGYPFGWVLPPETPVLTEGIALIEGAPHPEGGQAFYDFVTTKDALVQQAQDYGKTPAREDIEPARLPDWMADLDIDPLDVDWREFADNEEAWCQAWEERVFNAP
jgi:iron(III) transport system substrate-binding protein